MNIDIRKNILENFKDAKLEDINESIKEAIKDKDEIVLPGLGVLFEILWTNSNDNQKNEILQNIYEGIKKYD
ncbi:MAG: small acid-soluble spore protein SspI [Bacilli bacterium]|nr:small acid-soluble spore protein SspI [Bacilli bacterium]